MGSPLRAAALMSALHPSSRLATPSPMLGVAQKADQWLGTRLIVTVVGSTLPSEAVLSALVVSNSAVGRFGSVSQENGAVTMPGASVVEELQAPRASDDAARTSVPWSVRWFMIFRMDIGMLPLLKLTASRGIAPCL